MKCMFEGDWHTRTDDLEYKKKLIEFSLGIFFHRKNKQDKVFKSLNAYDFGNQKL